MNISNVTMGPSPVSSTFIDFTEQSVYVALGGMAAIVLFVLLLSVVSKQLERRSNLSHFDDVFLIHNATDDIEAQLKRTEAHDESTSGSDGTPTTISNAATRSSIRNNSVPEVKATTAITKCASLKSFTINMNPLLGSSKPDLPSISDLCSFDVVIASSRVKIMSLIHDCDNTCRELIVEEGKGSEVTTKKRPTFLCVIEFNEIKTGALARVSSLLNKGFDGIVLRGLGEAWRETRAKYRLSDVLTMKSKSKEWLDTTLSKVIEITASLEKPLIVEIDQTPMSGLDFRLLNGVLFRNPTVQRDGTPRPVWGDDRDALEKFVKGLKTHVSMSIDFTLLAINVVDGIDRVFPEQIERFSQLAWANRLPVVCRTCADLELMNRTETMLQMNSMISPLDIAQSEAASQMMMHVGRLIRGKETGQVMEMVDGRRRDNGLDIEGISVTLKKEDDNKFSDLEVQVSTLIETTVGEPIATSFWYVPDVGESLPSAANSSSSKRRTYQSKKTTPNRQGLLSSLGYLKLDDDDGLPEENGEDGMTHRPLWFDNSIIPEAAKGGKVPDPGGQKIIGQSIDGPEYTSVVGRLIGQRQTVHKKGCLLQNLSAPKMREKYSGDERQNNLMNTYDPAFVKIETNLRTMIQYLQVHKKNKVAAMVDRSRRSHEEKAEESKNSNMNNDAGKGNGVKRQRYAIQVDEILSTVPQINIRRMLKMLLERMHEVVTNVAGVVSRRIQLWSAYPRAMSTNVSGVMKTFIGIQQSAGDVTHIYLSLDHPDPTEGLLHCYFQSLGCGHRQCVALELLVRYCCTTSIHLSGVGAGIGSAAILLNESNYTEEDILEAEECLPQRIQTQLKQSSYEELTKFVQRTSKKLLLLRRVRDHVNGGGGGGSNSRTSSQADADVALRKILRRVVLSVRDIARNILLSDVTSQDRENRWANLTFYGSTTNGRDALIGEECDKEETETSGKRQLHKHTREYYLLLRLVRRACWRDREREQLTRLVKRLVATPLRTSSKNGIYLCMELTLALRAVIFDQYACDVREMDPFPIRDPDLSTVLLEMIGVSSENVRTLFGVEKRDCARAIHDRIQNIVHKENPPPSLFKPTQHYDMNEDDVSGKDRAMQYGNGMFFSSSVFLEQLLILSTGSGLFSSSSMSGVEMRMVSCAMLVGFIWNGGVNAAIGRTSSYYMFQWSFSLASVSAVERITAGILFSLPVALIGAVVAGVVEKSAIAALQFSTFFLLFFYYLMMISALVSIRIKSVWQSSGGRAIFTSYAILAAPAVATATGMMSFAVRYEILGWFYALALLLADIQMTISFHYICLARCKCFEGVSIVSDSDLNSWAYDNHFTLYKDPKAPMSAATSGLSGKKREAKRRFMLRMSYARAVREALRRRSSIFRACCNNRCADAWCDSSPLLTKRSQSWLVEQRCKNYGKEALLLKWYLLQASKAEPSPLSSEWESCVGEALAAMRQKRMTDVGIRPGLLFQFEAPEMIYGWLYFVFIFVDRLAYLVSGEGVFLFGADNRSSYSKGMGYATIYLLLGTGILEVAMHRLQTFQNRFSGMRMGMDGTKGMMRERIRRRQALYRRESFLLFRRLGIFWILMTLIVIATTWESQSILDLNHPIVPYFIGSFGYVGLVFALFNKLYMGTKIGAAVRLIFASVISGIVAGVTCLLLTGWGASASIATVVCGWMYGLGTFSYIHHRNESNVNKWGEDHKLLSPQVLTSGQTWVGAKEAMSMMSHRAVLKRLEHLPPDRRIGISCESKRGQRLLDKLKKLKFQVGMGRLHPCLEECFGKEGVVSILERAHEALVRNIAQIYICPEVEMCGNSGEGFSALAAMAPNGTSLQFSVYVAVPWQHRNNVGIVDQLLCEAYVHEISEHSLDFSHRCATLMELCVLPEGGSLYNPMGGATKGTKKKTKAKRSSTSLSNQSQSNFRRLPRRILTQIHAMDVRALHRVERDTDRSIYNNSTLGMDLGRHWSTMTHDVRFLVLRVVEYLRPSSRFTASRFDMDVHAPLIQAWGPARHQVAIAGLFDIFALSGCPFLLPQEADALEDCTSSTGSDRFASSLPSSRTSSPTQFLGMQSTELRRELLSTLVSRAHTASCLAVSIKQAVRVAMKHKLVNFYKPDMSAREWPTHCEDFGVFDEQLLQDFLDQSRQATPEQCRERLVRLRMTVSRVENELNEEKRRRIDIESSGLHSRLDQETQEREHLLDSQLRDLRERTRRVDADLRRSLQIHRAGGTEITEPELDYTWQMHMFFETLYLSMIGSSSFSQEAHWLLEEANVGSLLRWCVRNIAVPIHGVGRRLKVWAVDLILWKGRQDISALVSATELGLNRTLDVYEAVPRTGRAGDRKNKNAVVSSWYVQSFDPKKSEKCYLEVRQDTAESHVYMFNRNQKKKGGSNSNRERPAEGFLRARHYEPANQKGMMGVVKYHLRNNADLRGTNLPLAKMNTRELLDSKTGKLLSKIYYEYAEDSEESPFPAGAEFEDGQGQFIKKRFYDIRGRVTGETLSVPRKLNRRAPKVTSEKYHLTGWLSKRKKKTFGWTSKNLRFFVSDPTQGTLCFFKSNIEWKQGKEPRTIIPLNGIAIRPSDRGKFVLCDFASHTELYELTADSVKSKNRWIQAIQAAIKCADKKNGQKQNVKLTADDVRKANAARAAKNQQRAAQKKKKGQRRGQKNDPGGESPRKFGRGDGNTHRSKSLAENMKITCVYVHDDNIHPAESKALMSVYLCEEEDWAMVVMNCHREKENGVKVYSERVTGVSLRWGSTYYHTQYDYFHSSHRGHRSWKINSGGQEQDDTTDGDGSPVDRRQSTMAAPVTSVGEKMGRASVIGYNDSFEGQEETDFEQTFTGALLKSQNRRREQSQRIRTDSLHAQQGRRENIHASAKKKVNKQRRLSAKMLDGVNLEQLDDDDKELNNDMMMEMEGEEKSSNRRDPRRKSLLVSGAPRSDSGSPIPKQSRKHNKSGSLPDRPETLPSNSRPNKDVSTSVPPTLAAGKSHTAKIGKSASKRTSIFDIFSGNKSSATAKQGSSGVDPNRHNPTRVLQRVSTHIDFLHNQVQRKDKHLRNRRQQQGGQEEKLYPVPEDDQVNYHGSSRNRKYSNSHRNSRRSSASDEDRASTHAKRFSIVIKDPRMEATTDNDQEENGVVPEDDGDSGSGSNSGESYSNTSQKQTQHNHGLRRRRKRGTTSGGKQERRTGRSSQIDGHSGDKQQMISDAVSFSGQSEHETPWFVLQDPYNLIDRPPTTSIFNEDLSLLSVLPHPKFQRSAKGGRGGGCCRAPWCCFGGPRSFRFTTGRYPTGTARTSLWQLWNRSQGDLEGVHAQLLDERMLRGESLLAEYWQERDGGRLNHAREVIRGDREGEMRGQHMSDIVNACFVQTDVATRSRLWMRFSDLLVGGMGGQSIFVAAKSDHNGTTESGGNAFLRVMGLDSGTWPMDGGGVASCRRDVVNRIDGVRWEMVSETGNDMKTVHRSYQVEAHVQSLNFVPLWGTDLGSPIQNVLSHEPVLKLKLNGWRLGRSVVREYFLPLIRNLVLGCSMHHFEASDIERFTTTFVNLHTFFQHYGWLKAWESGQTIRCWCDSWAEVYEDMRDQHGTVGRYDGDDQDTAMLDAEVPTLEDMLVTLSLFTHFLKPLAVPLDTHLNVPVAHASHHGIQTILGVIAKRKNGTALIVWDHGILWRERLRAFSNFRGFPLFARNVLVGLNRLVVQINFCNADVVVPCCRTNMDWELWIGSLRGNDTLRRTMQQYVFPVTNGMETDRFGVDRDNEEKNPTAVMLSHVYELKGVMDAIRAAGVIVQKYGLVEYRLLIYGSLDKDPTYVSECRALISANNLQQNVHLMGLGNAPKVLTRGWVFVNSSLSEGLPLALGEAGLCGLPVVCTDVGGSREVISQSMPKGGSVTYGRVVPPRNPLRLAQAQLETMAMLDGLQEIVSVTTKTNESGNGGSSSTTPSATSTSGENSSKLRAAATKIRVGVRLKSKKSGSSVRHPQLTDYADGPALLRRIRSQRKNCRLLGMKFREFVLSNFTMSRYLREHYATMCIAHSIYVARAASDSTGDEHNIDALIQANDADIAVIRDELLASNADRKSLSRINRRVSLDETMAGMMLRNRHDAGNRSSRKSAEDSDTSTDSDSSTSEEEEDTAEASAKNKARSRFKSQRPTIQTDVQTLKRIVSVYGEMHDIPTAKLERRSNIIEEILQTEASFVYDMETLRDLFCHPMRNQFPSLYNEGDMHLLSDTLEEMLVHQTKLLKTLKGAGIISNTVTGQSSYVGKSLAEYAPAMKFMATYTMSVQNHCVLMCC